MNKLVVAAKRVGLLIIVYTIEATIKSMAPSKQLCVYHVSTSSCSEIHTSLWHLNKQKTSVAINLVF
jgi:hypothetical protein